MRSRGVFLGATGAYVVRYEVTGDPVRDVPVEVEAAKEAKVVLPPR